MLIKGGKIIDGSGKKMFSGDIRIEGEKIKEIGKLKPAKGEESINARAFYICPGFVDILNHSDAYVTLFDNPNQSSLLQQGITTILMGNCGSSLAPLVDGIFINSIQKWGDISKINVNWLGVGEYLNELKRHKFGLNIATQIGHSTIRRALVKNEARSLNTSEQEQLEYMIETGLREGAFGVSTGLAYSHGASATAKELRAVMNIVKKYNGLYSTHIRDEGTNFLDAVKETVSLAKETGVNTQVSHFKVTEKDFWDKFPKALELVEKTENINFDIYPYNFTASVLYTFLPRWASSGGNATLMPAIKNQETRNRLEKEMKNDPYTYGDMIVASGAISDIYFGRKIAEIAKNQDKQVEEVVLDLIMTSGNRLIVFNPAISGENIKLAVESKKSFVSSDGAGYKEGNVTSGRVVHPRYFGAMPKFLNKFVKNEKALSWEEAINKITFGPAQKIGLRNRGKLEKGYFADIVIFNPDEIKSNASITNPYLYPSGINQIIVNGQTAIENNESKNNAGHVLVK